MSNPTMFKEDLKEYAGRWQPVADEFGLPWPDLDAVVGCGLYGCVFGTQDPKTVVKLTQRYAEAAFMDLQSRAKFTGVTEVQKVIQISRYDFLIWREYLDTCCRKAFHSIANEHKISPEYLEDKWAYCMDRYIQAESAKKIDAALKAMAGIDGLRDMAQGLMDIVETFGIRLEDVHINNVGRFNDYDQLIIFDMDPVHEFDEFSEEILQVK